jgi:uncharacterized Tic20 family protein
MTDTPPPVIRTDDKLWIVLSHLSILLGVGLLLPLIVYLVKKDESPVLGANAKEALNFHISVYLYALICIPLMLVIIGLPLLMMVGIGAVVLSIVAAVRTANGSDYRYPLTIRLVR